MLTTDCFDGISMFSVAWTPFELFFLKGLNPTMKIEIEQNMFPYKVHAYAVISFIHYYHVLNLLPPQVVYARNSLLLHIILLCIKTPQTRVKRFLSKNQVSRVGEKSTQTR